MLYNRKPGKKIIKYGNLINDNLPQITIITPYYNGGATLMETANTIFSQTYPYFEWILIDDGSKDELSLKKLEELKKLDKRVKVLHKENGGPSQARDYGIKHAAPSSEYIYFIDCDDIIENTMLETLYWTLQTHKDCTLAYTSMINFGAHEYYWEPYLTLEEELVTNLMCISTMIRKKDLLEVDCFGIKEKGMYEDWNLWLKLLAKGKKPIRTNAPLFWYRTSNTGELSRARKNDKKAKSLIKKTAKTVKNDVEIVQFPKKMQSISFNNNVKDSILPKYDSQNTIMFLIDDNIPKLENIKMLEIIKNLNQENNIIVVTFTPCSIELRQEIKDNCQEFHNLSNFLEVNDYYNFLNYLVSSRNVSKVVTNSNYGYAYLPKLKEENDITIIDYSIDKDIINDHEKIYDCIITKNKLNEVQIKENNKENKLNILDNDKTKLKDQYKINNNSKVISFVDSLDLNNNVMLLLDIAKKIERNDITFIINGNGLFEEKVKRFISKNRLMDKIKYFKEEEMSKDDALAISDVLINCQLKEFESVTIYNAIINKIPFIVANIQDEENYLQEEIGMFIKYSYDNSQKAVDEFVKLIDEVLSNLKKYNTNISLYNQKLEKEIESTTIIIKNAGKTVSKNVIPSNIIYENYIRQIIARYNIQYLDYYKDNHKLEPREEFPQDKLTKLKRKLRKFGLENGVVEEMHYVLNNFMMLTKVISKLGKFIIISIKYILTIPKLLFVLIKLILKLIRKLLSNIKQLIIN